MSKNTKKDKCVRNIHKDSEPYRVSCLPGSLLTTHKFTGFGSEILEKDSFDDIKEDPYFGDESFDIENGEVVEKEDNDNNGGE